MSDSSATPDRYEITTESARFDLDLIHRYLSEESYWASGIPREVVERSIRHSLCFGILEAATGELAGFARVTTEAQPSPISPMSLCCRRIVDADCPSASCGRFSPIRNCRGCAAG